VRLLVIGGTRFVGRHFVEAALAAGHEVTLFHRGRSGDDLFAQATHLHGDRDDVESLRAALGSSGDGWDATIDTCAYVPRQIRELGDVLGGVDGRAGHYVLISSISAYADADAAGITEDAPLAQLSDQDTEEVTGDTYGGLKALCEYAAVEVFGTRSLVVRPTYVVGPHDPTGRFTYWVQRLARGGEVLAAGPAEQPIQVVDGRDLATLTLALVEKGESGAVHAAAPSASAGGSPYSIADLLDEVATAVAPDGTSVTWVDPAFVEREGLDGVVLPMWHGPAMEWVGAVDSSRALGLGFAPRPVADSARDVLGDPTTPLVGGVGLEPERESDLLARWHSDH
jgi:2'-hydroxyisoflavone reductase